MGNVLVRICAVCRCAGARDQQEEGIDDDDSGISSTDDDVLYTRDMITVRNSIICTVYEWIKNNISGANQADDGHLVEDIVIQNEYI